MTREGSALAPFDELPLLDTQTVKVEAECRMIPPHMKRLVIFVNTVDSCHAEQSDHQTTMIPKQFKYLSPLNCASEDKRLHN